MISRGSLPALDPYRPPAREPSPAWRTPHAPPARLASVVVAGLALCVALQVCLLIDHLVTVPGHLGLAPAYGGLVSGPWMDTIVQAAGLTNTVTGLLFLVWLGLAARTSRELDHRSDLTPWTLLWFIVPVANFIVPYLFVARILRTSVALDPRKPPPRPPLPSLWWAAILVWLLLPYARPLFMAIPSAASFVVYRLIIYGSGIVGLLLTVALVRAITGAHERAALGTTAAAT